MELETDKPLVLEFLVNGERYRLEYESLPALCIACGCLGHEVNKCVNVMEVANANDQSDSR